MNKEVTIPSVADIIRGGQKAAPDIGALLKVV